MNFGEQRAIGGDRPYINAELLERRGARLF